MNSKEFLRILYEGQFATKEQITECYALFQKQIQNGKTASLEAIFLHKGYLSQNQIHSIIQNGYTKTREHNTEKNILFNRYEVIKELGRGGMGIVYEVYDKNIGRNVALKVIIHQGNISSQRQNKRFEREARLLAKLSHPHIIKVYDTGFHENQFYFTMELIEGESFSEYLKKNKSLNELLSIFHKIVEAVHYAHENGVIHRDLKPSNILLTKNGEPKILDFGLAKHKNSEDLTLSADMIGTPEYTSPEQVSEKKLQIDARSDIYSLGVILYQILTGRTPFTGTPVNVIYQIMFNDPIIPSHFHNRLHKDLEAICLKSLEKKEFVVTKVLIL